jgi:hypothetical protein
VSIGTTTSWRRRFAAAGALVALAGAAAGCGGGGSSTPSWAAGLGAGVTVSAPKAQSPGHSSPGAVVQSYIYLADGPSLVAVCADLEPVVQAPCQKDLTGHSSGGASLTNFALGYVAVKGDQALVGITGTDCEPGETPKCATNSDPAALLSSGKSFATLYSESVATRTSTSDANVYSPAPCIKVGSSWYVYLPPSTF